MSGSLPLRVSGSLPLMVSGSLPLMVSVFLPLMVSLSNHGTRLLDRVLILLPNYLLGAANYLLLSLRIGTLTLQI